MKMHKSMIVACLFLAGCGAKTPEEVVRAWAGAMRDADAEDVMYYALQDQKQPRFDLKNEVQMTDFKVKMDTERKTNDYWKNVEKGRLYREFIRGDRAWVTVGKEGCTLSCFELYRYQGKWKVMDPEYSLMATRTGMAK